MAPPVPSNAKPVAAIVGFDWSPSVTEAAKYPTPKLTVRRLSEWIVLVTKDVQGNTWALLRAPGDADPPFEGYVPAAIIKIGASVKDGPLPLSMPAPMPPTLFPEPIPNDRVATRTIKLLWKSITMNRDTIMSRGHGTRTQERALFGSQVHRYAETIMNAIPRRALDAIETGRFDPKDLCNLLSPVSPTAHPPETTFGVYIVIAKSVSGNYSNLVSPPSKDAIYIGQSVNFNRRWLEHLKNVREANSRSAISYQVMSKASSFMMYPLVVFNTKNIPQVHGLDNALLMNTAEFTMLFMFQSLWPRLVDGTEITARNAVAAGDQETAQKITALAKAVFDASGWRPRRSIGMNWDIPLLSRLPKEYEWLGWEDTDRMSTIYRLRCKVFVTAAGSRGTEAAIYFKHDDSLNISKALREEAGFQDRDICVLQVEIFKNADGTCRKHDHQFARVPVPCFNQEVDKLASMTTQIQWVDKASGSWKSALLQVFDSRRRSQTHPNMYSGTITAMNLFNSVTQTVYQNGPSWMPSIDRAVVRMVEVKHLEQKAVLTDPITRKAIQWPPNRTKAEVGSIIQAKVNQLPPSWQSSIAVERKPAGSRKFCDLNHSLADTVASHWNEATRSCAVCEGWGRPCTWTDYNRSIMGGNSIADHLKSDGRLNFLGWPTNIQAMADKTSQARNRRVLIKTMPAGSEPFSAALARQLDLGVTEPTISSY
ncbi:uncharacterized protein J7T54_004441 [Emericellopsis cladophorae]|uniref:GIY-YIG domain-containing protein n=1 Tax=Emericellopsis cladophorae TaxID=2686198 RepID=A0A9P9Y4K5_9HYPO|nr:uncharacterized protein J7T54_004441 [Emericellopsis cladophorae]KAI6783414.1 hypothetical protein J7T54_004441 [Emericellopsis cladophorae]